MGEARKKTQLLNATTTIRSISIKGIDERYFIKSQQINSKRTSQPQFITSTSSVTSHQCGRSKATKASLSRLGPSRYYAVGLYLFLDITDCLVWLLPISQLTNINTWDESSLVVMRDDGGDHTTAADSTTPAHQTKANVFGAHVQHIRRTLLIKLRHRYRYRRTSSPNTGPGQQSN